MIFVYVCKLIYKIIASVRKNRRLEWIDIVDYFQYEKNAHRELRKVCVISGCVSRKHWCFLLARSVQEIRV
jgi:hypothetical protein